MDIKEKKYTSRLLSVWIFVILSIGIVVVGYVLYDTQKKQIKYNVQKQLSTITRLKAERITEWKYERLSDAIEIRNNVMFSHRLKEYLNDISLEQQRDQLTYSLPYIENHWGLRRVLITDRYGAVVFSTIIDNRVIDRFIQPLIEKALTTKDVAFSDLYMNHNKIVCLTFVIPVLLRTAGEVIGTIVLDIDPYKELFPIIQSWPVESASAETLLVRKDGNDVVYLNELRHKKDTALKLRLPLDKHPLLPATMAVQGQRGVVEGVDYREQPVLAAIMPIQDTPWFIISKIDQDEIYAPIKSLSRVAAIIIALLLTLAGMGVTAVWYRREIYTAKVFERRLERERDLLRMYLDILGVMVVLLDVRGRVALINKKGCEILAYKEEEIIGKDWFDNFLPQNMRVTVKGVFDQIITGDVAGVEFYENPILRNTGDERIIHWHNTYIKDDDGKIINLLSSGEDITELKQMQQKLVRANRLYAVLSQINQTIVQLKDEAALFNEICRICIEYGEFTMAWVGLIDREIRLVKPAAYAGLVDGYLNEIQISIDDTPEGLGPTGTAIRTGMYSICNDVLTEPRMAPWREQALKRGYLSSAAFPIHVQGEVIAALSLYSCQKGYFQEAECKLLEEVAVDISYAIEILERERAQKRAEVTIERQLKRNKMILDTAINGFILVDLKGNVKEVNPAFSDLLGYTSEELCSMNVRDFDIGQSDEEIIKRMGDILQTGGIRFETIHQGKDGRRVNIAVSASCIDLEGETMIFAFHNDITERVKSMEKISRLSFIVNQSPLVVIMTDLEGNIEYVNPRFTEMTGYTLDEVRGKTPRIQKSGKHTKEFYENLWQTITLGNIWQGEFINKKKNCDLYIEKALISPIRDVSGAITHFVGIKEDITEKKHMEKLFLLRERQAKMGEMLSIIAHQWKQPISAVTASINRLELELMFDTMDKEVLTESLDRMKSQVAHMSQTIDDFRSFFKPDKGKTTSHMETILQKTLNIVKEQFENDGIEIDFKCRSATLLETYVNELVQVFLSIIENAKETFLNRNVPAPMITIDVHEEDMYVVIDISDNAGGIAPETIDNIFFPYYSTKDEVQGTGLGLYMAKMVVEQHCNGNIYAVNTKDGARFTIKIPIDKTD
ncbi:MAG: PAS domain S-box protein [Nitrospirae bacterium]|nr:PAS domain S-box protein [Nitrospirota bacterium]